MDDRIKLLENLTKSFNRDDLTQFMRASSGKFKPEKADYSHLVNVDFIKDLVQLGRIDFEDGRRLIVLAGEVDKDLTSHSGKKKQYEVAQKVLGNEYDEGIFVFHDRTGNFRFSLVAIGYRDGKKVLTSFRRYTYFITANQPTHTFIKRIGKEKIFETYDSTLEAFSIEPVSDEFFQEYGRIFEEAEKSITLDWSTEQKRLYTQRFFNRLMFIAFLERKGWLKFNGQTTYLKALIDDYYRNDLDKRRSANFHRKKLDTLFFMGLNNEYGRNLLQSDPTYKIIRDQIGEVPFLNGGLFEREKNEDEGSERWFFPDSIVAEILEKLVYRFNFTVSESTPLDLEVAVDPEMLGRIFEELVTGRHESGSYYTPKPVVQFMCREALKGYLSASLPSETKEALSIFVDENDAKGLNNIEAVLNALRSG